MYKFAVLLLMLPAVLVAQNADSQTSPGQSSSMIQTSSADMSSAGGGASMSQPSQTASTPRDGFMHRGVFTSRDRKAPVGSLSLQGVYMYSPGLVGANRSLMGWGVMPEVNFTKYLGLQADFENLYIRSINEDENRFVAAAGPRINFAPRSKFTPFVYMEGGETRITRQQYRYSDWNPVAKGGLGMDFKIAHGFGFQLIPGEYQGQYLDNGTWTHSFVARAGISFSLFK
jgi:hypothetical protein